MICEHCKQRHATVTVTQVNNDQTVEKHYCEQCASKFHPFQTDIQEEPVNLHQLISNWFGVPVFKGNQAEGKKQPETTCSCCGLTYRQFLKHGKFGCPKCYDTFREQLPPVFSKLQAGTTHTGKAVAINLEQLKKKIKDIRAQMQLAITDERFEDAAKMRDEIKAIQQKLDAGGVDV